MCLQVNRIEKKGQYKETTWNGKKGDTYDIQAWTKCGACIECMNEKANAWLVRNKYENKSHKEKCFITLTYAKNPRYLVRKHIQDFFKRLRKHLEPTGKKIRYFGCGEYGTLKGRPHYHAIIYGWKPEDAVFEDFSKKGTIMFQSKILTKIWGHGRTIVQRAEDKTIPYMALYNSPNLENRKKMYARKSEIKELYKYHNYEYQKKLDKQLEKNKGDYTEIKEFNFYSQGLGFNNFIKNYNTVKETWTEHINDMDIAIPSAWIKRMANAGEVYAIKEMHKRKEIEKQREQTTEERHKEKRAKTHEQNNREIIQTIKKPTETAYF